MKSMNNSGPSTLPWGTPDWTGFHPEKCQVLHISNKRNPFKYNYNIHGHILEEAATSKYLGINLNRTLSWNNHINTVAKKAINISYFQNAVICKKSYC
jgi:hypothetical protein